MDIGSGKGRNSVHLASLGYDVYAMEYIQPAIDVAEVLAQERGVSGKVHFANAEIDKRWHYDDSFFDIAIDSFSSIDVETRRGREILRDEMFRTLKPGGWALVTVCAADDEWERELIVSHPGREPNSTIWPQTGKFQKDYTEEELKGFYENFEIVEVRKIRKPAFKMGRSGMATNLWAVLRKPT